MHSVQWRHLIIIGFRVFSRVDTAYGHVLSNAQKMSCSTFQATAISTTSAYPRILGFFTARE